MTWALTLLLLADPGQSLESRVNRALDSAAANLISRQAADGSWQKDDKVHPLGRTALCTYALLHAGLPADHAAVQKALAFLAPRAPRSTYEAGCLLLLYHALGKEYDKRIHTICAWLVDTFDAGPKLWGYPGSAPDLSNTQYAVFGLRVGEMHGYRVPKNIWRDVSTGVLRLQTEDGAFRYKQDAIYRASMTHAGLLMLLFAYHGKPPSKVKKAMRRGHAWFEKNYRVDFTPWGRGFHKGYYYYYMYGLERYAQLFGFKAIGGHDWYREGAEELLRRQEENGSWGNLQDTSFAVLFLRKVTFTVPRKRDVGVAAKGKKKPAAPAPPQNTPFIRRWLLSGPYPAKRRFEDDMLFEEHFKPSRLGGKKEWIVHEASEDMVDLGKACGETEWCTYYAALYLSAESACEAVLWFGTDDGCKLFLNGDEVFEGHHHDFCGDDFYRVPLALKKGRNLLVLRIENHGYYARLKARLSAAAGVTADVRR